MPEEKVQNQKATVLPSESVYNDSDKLNSLLVIAKHVNMMYCYFAEEASNDTLYKEVVQLQQQTSQLSRTTFNLMFEKGWYVLEKQPSQKISTMASQFKQKETQLKSK